MKQKLANLPPWLKRATPQASFWVFLHLKGPSINEVTTFYSFLTPFSSTLPIFYQIRHQIFLNFWLLPPIERRRCLWTALQVKLLWTKRSFLPFVLDEGTWVPVFFCTQTRISGEWTDQLFWNLLLQTLGQGVPVWPKIF